MNLSKIVAIFLGFLVFAISAHNPCISRATDSGSVCVCNSTYCDTIPVEEQLQPGDYQLYTTSKANLGFWTVSGHFSNTTKDSDVTVIVQNVTTIYQTVLGFGGAFTDAAGINLLRLSEPAQDKLIEAYFGEEGLQYSIGRVPIGGTDFSTKPYTYCDEEDASLGKFALQQEDFLYKIPFVQKALELRGRDNIKLIASAWSAPVWMKTPRTFNLFNHLNEDFYSIWAQYYLKFFDAYTNYHIDFWGVTTQNEPVDGLIGSRVQSNGFNSKQMRSWIKNYFGPTIRNSTYKDLKIIAHDDQTLLLPLVKYNVLSDLEVLQYVDGIGIHWYTNFFLPSWFLLIAANPNKDLMRIATEACIDSFTAFGVVVDFGSWNRGERYMNDIMNDLAYDFVGWIDWNLALNETGGPNWIENETDAPIIVNGTADEFYKQPMYYAVGHFSKFVVPGSVRVGTTSSEFDVKALAFLRPDTRIALVMWNRTSSPKVITLDILGSTETIIIEAYSFNTLLYKPTE